MHHKSLYPDIPTIAPQNFHHLLFNRPDQKEWNLDYTVQIDPMTSKRRSYREFYDCIMDGATALGSPVSERGLGLNGTDGEIVGILSENCMSYITLVHSLLAITTPFALLSSYSTPSELVHALRLSKATRIFVQAKFFSLVLRAAKNVGLPDSHIYIMEGHVKGRRTFDEMIHQVRKEFTPRLAVRPAGKDTLAYLVFSSGTSGLPKAVMISHGNLCVMTLQTMVIAQAKAQVSTPSALNTPEGIPVFLGVLPMYHSYGLHLFCFRAFMARTTVVLMPKWNMDMALKLIAKYRITHLCLIPSLMHQLVNSRQAKQADLSSLVFVSSGAAYLSESLATKFVKLGPKNIEMLEGYGLSESTLTAAAKPFPGTLGGRVKNVPGSAGVLLPSVEARIVRDDGTDAGVNEPGELWLRSGAVALGYWNNEDASRETFADGWLKTGDQFLVDKDETFYFLDRIKDTLKVSGMQVSPVEIENILLAHPDRLISDVTVAGVLGGRTTDEKIPRAWVVLSETGTQKGAMGVIKALDIWSRSNLSKYKWLRGGIEVVNEIPKSPTGKVLRRVLQDAYNQRVTKCQTKL